MTTTNPGDGTTPDDDEEPNPVELPTDPPRVVPGTGSIERDVGES